MGPTLRKEEVPSARANVRWRTLLPTGECFAVLLDLENLTAELRRQGDWSGAAHLLKALMFKIAMRGRVETCVAYGDRRLVRDLGPKLESSGIRAVAHRGGANEADLCLIERLRSLPPECTTVVIGSGDRIFADEARRLRSVGKRVEAVARPGTISAELYASVDEYLPLICD